MRKKARRIFTFASIAESGSTKTEARENCMTRARTVVDQLTIAAERHPLRGLGDIHFVYLKVTEYGPEYGWIDETSDVGRTVTTGFKTVNEAVMAAIEHVADLFAGGPLATDFEVAEAEAWISRAGKAWFVSPSNIEGIKANIQDKRVKRAEMVKKDE
jgi:hypothetical protein